MFHITRLAEQALELASKNMHHAATDGRFLSSAIMCYEDAKHAKSKGDYHHAFKRAVDSLRYSVGIFNAEYRRLVAMGQLESETVQLA